MSSFRPTIFLPYVYRIVLLASFSFGCTISLSLQDYIGKEISIGHGENNNNNDMIALDDDGLVSQGLFEGEPDTSSTQSTSSTSTACSASDATSTIDCPFYSPYMEGATLYSQMTSSPCDDHDGVDIDGDATTAQKEGEDVVVASAPYPVDINGTINGTTVTTSNNTTANATYCARASLYDDAASIAVMTISIELTLTFNYSANGTFAIDTIQTQVRNPDGTSVEAQATRAVYVRGRYGRCDAPNIDDADGAATPELGVGDVLAVCAYVEGEEEDVEIGGIRYVTLRDGGDATAGDGGGAVLAMPVDEDRGVNFVTVLTPNVNGDNDDTNNNNNNNSNSSKSVTIETLLTPQIFDQGVGDTLVVSGVVDLKYVDASSAGEGSRERRRRRRLQVANGPSREFFNVVVSLRKTKDLPRVAEGLFMDKITNGAAAVDDKCCGKWIRRLWRWRGNSTSKALYRVFVSSALAMPVIV